MLWAWLIVGCIVVKSAFASSSYCSGAARNGSAGSISSSCVAFQFGGMYVDFEHPLQCGGTVSSWNLDCSNDFASSRAYLTVWRRSAVRASFLDRIYIQELNSTTVPRCPGTLESNTLVYVNEGDYVGLLVPSVGSSQKFVCDCSTSHLGFIQAINETDDGAYLASAASNKSLFMTLDACLVGITAVIGPQSIVQASMPTYQQGQTAPSVSSISAVEASSLPTSGGASRDKGSGGGELLSIVAATLAAALVALVLTGLTAMVCMAVRRRRKGRGTEVAKSNSIGNAIYAVSGCDTGRVNGGGPIYEVPSTTCSNTMGSEATYLGSDYEVGVTPPAGQTDCAYEFATECRQLEATYALAGQSTLPGRARDAPAHSESFGHHYHLLEQVVAGEYIYDDVLPFRQPPGHVSELYAELTKFNVGKIPREEISVVGPVGSGHFGLVSSGVWRDPRGSAHEVAVKSLSSGSDQLGKVKFLQEAAIMAQFKHPNVVHLYGCVIEGDPVLLVLEYLHNGDLFQYLQQMRTRSELQLPPTTATTLLEMCQQVAFGMHYLCSKGFIHRDLAARNILVSKECVCKIADFGLSRDLADENYYVSKGGAIPVKWTAPEAVLYKKYSTASDVWSYGCLMYEIWSVGRKPFEGCDNIQVIQRVTSGHRLPPPPGCPRLVYKLMIACWHPDSTLRPMFRDILAILIGHNGTILGIPDDIIAAGTQATVLGAPLEASLTLYSDLQSIYNICLPS